MTWKTATAFLILFAAYQAPQLFFARTGNPVLFVLLSVGFLLVAYGVARWTAGMGWAAYYLPLKSTGIYWLCLGLPLGLVSSALGTWSGIALGYAVISQVLDWRSHALYLALVYAVSFVSSAAEDIVTRGFLLRNWPTKLARWFVPLSALVYVLNHIFVLSKGPSLWCFLYLLGIALAWPLWKKGQMWLTVGAHWGWNIAFHTADNLFVEQVKSPTGARWSMSIGAFTLVVLLVAISAWIRPEERS